MVREDEGEQGARENASFAEILSDELPCFFDDGENDDGYGEEEEPLDADKGEEESGKEHAEIIRRRGLEEE